MLHKCRISAIIAGKYSTNSQHKSIVCTHRYYTILPVQARFILQDVRMDQLFKQTVHQDGQRGEADVVQCQINTVIQSLNGTEPEFHSTSAYWL